MKLTRHHYSSTTTKIGRIGRVSRNTHPRVAFGYRRIGAANMHGLEQDEGWMAEIDRSFKVLRWSCLKTWSFSSKSDKG
jgi:hypothetical protein